jgi:Family of unknown function (DUF6390)
MDAEGVALCARFSIATNRLQFCGPADAAPDLYAAITRGERVEEAGRALARFEALYPYLEAIGAMHGREPFDREVVEAYWLGNRLLDRFGREEFSAILDALVRRGLPSPTARRLTEHLPEGALPHHVFHVAYVGVGEVTGHVETTLRNMEQCRPKLATVVRLRDRTLLLRAPSLTLQDGRLALGADSEFERAYEPEILPQVGVGSAVALHWDHPAIELRPAQADALRRYTDLCVAAANRALPGLRELE